jgi:hypothetical protein
VTVPTLPQRVDLAAFVEQLDPGQADDRAIARALRGVNRGTDAAIRGRFRDVDLDASSSFSRSLAGVEGEFHDAVDVCMRRLTPRHLR